MDIDSITKAITKEITLKKVRSKYVIKIIFENLKESKLLGIIKYNKYFQNKLEIGINHYKVYCQPLTIKEFKTNPKDINVPFNKYIQDSDSRNTFSDNVFIIFKALDKIYYIVYADKNESIISFDLINNRVKYKKTQKKDACSTCFNHYQDNNKKRDLIMAIEPGTNSIKVFNFSNCDLIYFFKNINKNGYLNVANFFSDDNNIFIMTSNHRYSTKNVDPVKIYDLKGKKIKELKDTTENISFLDSYYDKKTDKKYIIVGFSRYIKAINFKENSIYKVFKDKYNSYHRNVIIDDKDDKVIRLIESDSDGYLRIWDFHQAKLIKRIQINKTKKEEIFGFCLWNNDNVFVGGNNRIVLININTEEIISELNYNLKNEKCIVHHEDVISVKKVIHPKYGECLFTKAQGEKGIKMWTSKK